MESVDPGFVLRQSKLLRQPAKEELFEDSPQWELDEEECASVSVPVSTTNVLATSDAGQGHTTSVHSVQAAAVQNDPEHVA